jgi:hypothetical protein
MIPAFMDKSIIQLKNKFSGVDHRGRRSSLSGHDHHGATHRPLEAYAMVAVI